MNDPPLSCPSCGALRQSRYCTDCGERFLAHNEFELRHFLFEQLPDEMLHIDGKLPRTMRLLFTQPGALAKNYVAGRRQPYVGLLRIYIVLFLLHAAVAVFVSAPGISLPERVRDFDPFGVLSHLISTRPSVDWLSPIVAARARELGHWLSELATLMIFMITAGLQKLIFHRLHRPYLEHVALALNVASFYLSVLTLGDLLVWAAVRHQLADLEPAIQSLMALSALPIYWLFAIRRFYDLKIWISAGAAILVTAAQAAVAAGLNTLVYSFIILSIK